jgi:DNA-binding CsgD family transcriptional regulator
MLCPEVVGRFDELSRVSAALAGMAEGRGDCLFLVGEPGIGKSRMAVEAIAEAERRGVAVWAGRASPTGTAVPYRPLTSAVLHGLRDKPLTELPGVAGLRAGLAALLPGFVEGPPIPPSPVLLGETVLRLAGRMSDGRGTLIVIDDLQWADGDTLAVIEYLADNAARERVVVLGTSRPDQEILMLIDALERRSVASARTLAPLGQNDVEKMTIACLDAPAAEVPEQVRTVIVSQAEGLPFLVEELLAGMANRGLLVRSEAGWEIRGELFVDVPLSFAQTVRDRLSELGADGTRVIEAAAVLGRDFDWRRLAGIADVGEAEVLDVLARAVELQLVDERDEGRFRFRHVLTVDALVDRILLPQRALLAERALDQLIRDALQGEQVDLAAHLAVQAGRRTDASRFLCEEARRALAAGAVSTAVAAARRAVDMVDAEELEAAAAGEVLLSALSASGDAMAVQQIGGWLLARLDAMGASAARKTRVMLLQARAALSSLDLARARRLCDVALGLGPDTRLRLELDMALAEVEFTEHHHLAAVAVADAVLADADASGFADIACDALDLLGRNALFVDMQLRRAELFLLGALERAKRADLPLRRIRALTQLVYVEVAHGTGLGRLNEARVLAEELGVLGATAELDYLLAIVLAGMEDLDLAADCATRALRAARRYRLDELAAVVAGFRAVIDVIRGRREEAEQGVAEALAGATFGPQIRAAVAGPPLVLAALADDDLARAREHVMDTRALLRAASPTMLFQPPVLGFFYGLAAVVIAASGATELVEGRDWRALDDLFVYNSFLIARAIVAGRRGDPDGAATLFEEGDRGLAAARWFRALYRRWAAEAALQDGWGEPASWLAYSEEYFDARHEEALARACRSLLRVAGAPSRRRRSARPTHAARGGAALGLTTREADVLALVAHGLTNRQIAARLYLSTRTVEKHVERILAKTGMPNRTALAGLATEGGRPETPA